MNRRRAVQLALLAAFLPSWVARASTAPGRRSALFEAHRRAVLVGRPLLVLIVPDEPEAHARGQAFGALLNHGGDEALAVFALCEVVCAETGPLAELAGQAVPEDARFALVETDRVPAAVRFDVGSMPARIGADFVAAMDVVTEGQLRADREALVRVVIPDRGALARYATQEAAAGVADGPAALALAAADGRTDPAPVTARLAEIARDAWVRRVVPGSRWAESSGCGVWVEGADDNVGVDCGMGHVSAKARRMLYFF